jgi:ribosomal protein S18 acetylase RimI-like enzyme
MVLHASGLRVSRRRRPGHEILNAGLLRVWLPSGAMPDVAIEVATEPTGELRDALNHLLPQLSTSAAPLTDADVARLVGAEANTVFVARAGGRIVGALTLAVFPIPTGTRAWIEDVVVDAGARGLGVGAALNQAALERARDLGARTVDLTSRPSREAANRLYRRLGFQARETNVYRFSWDG